MVTMLIDHIGYLFFPGDASWRIIGRLAFPIYAYALVLGYHRTRNLPRYLRRIALIAALSQIPYMMAFDVMEVNVVGTLLVCLLLLWLLDRWKQSMPLQAIAILAGTALLEIVPCDYGAYALVLVLIYRYAPAKWMMLAHLALNLFFLFHKGWDIQLFSLLATILLVYLPDFIKAANRIPVPKLLWRSFYPLHLLILALLHHYVNNV